MPQLGYPRDPRYHLAVPGYELFKASHQMVAKLSLPDTRVVEVYDLIEYASAYCTYLLSRVFYCKLLPPGLHLEDLIKIDSFLKALLEPPSPAMHLSMLGRIHYLLDCLLIARADELKITINHMKLEKADTCVHSVTNPYYMDLANYHHDFAMKTQNLELDLEQELHGVEVLIAYLNQNRES